MAVAAISFLTGAAMNLFIRKKAYNLLDRYDVLDDTGRLAYTADGLLIRFKGYLVVRDRAGIELLTLKKGANLLFANYTLTASEDAGKVLATMEQQFERCPAFDIAIGKERLKLRGNLRACDFEILRDMEPHARIRKRELRWGETYVLSVTNIQDAPVYCAITAALDNALFHNR